MGWGCAGGRPPPACLVQAAEPLRGRHVTLPPFALPLPHASPAADAEEGGETAFPAGKWLNKELQAAGKPFSDCARSGVAALPR